MRRGDISQRRSNWVAADADSKGAAIRKWSNVFIILAVIGGSLYILSLAGKVKRLLTANCETEKAAVWAHQVAYSGHDEKAGDYLLLVKGGDTLKFFDRHETGILPIAHVGDSIFKAAGTFDLEWKRTGASESMLLLAGKVACE